jgi:hypothetical protein
MKTLIEELFPTNIRASTNSVTVVSPSLLMWFSSNDFSLGNTSSDSSEKNSTKKSPPTPVDPRKSNEIT